MLLEELRRKDPAYMLKLNTVSLNLAGCIRSGHAVKDKRKTPAIIPGFSLPFNLTKSLECGRQTSY